MNLAHYATQLEAARPAAYRNIGPQQKASIWIMDARGRCTAATFALEAGSQHMQLVCMPISHINPAAFVALNQFCSQVIQVFSWKFLTLEQTSTGGNSMCNVPEWCQNCDPQCGTNIPCESIHLKV